MQVTFKANDQVEINNPPHQSQDPEKDAKVYDKCLQTYLYMVINNLKKFSDEEGNTFKIEPRKQNAIYS